MQNPGFICQDEWASSFVLENRHSGDGNSMRLASALGSCSTAGPERYPRIG